MSTDQHLQGTQARRVRALRLRHGLAWNTGGGHLLLGIPPTRGWVEANRAVEKALANLEAAQARLDAVLSQQPDRSPGAWG